MQKRDSRREILEERLQKRVLQKSLVLLCRYSSLEERFEKRDCRREIAEEGVAEVSCAVFLDQEIPEARLQKRDSYAMGWLWFVGSIKF